MWNNEDRTTLYRFNRRTREVDAVEIRGSEHILNHDWVKYADINQFIYYEMLGNWREYRFPRKTFQELDESYVPHEVLMIKLLTGE